MSQDPARQTPRPISRHTALKNFGAAGAAPSIILLSALLMAAVQGAAPAADNGGFRLRFGTHGISSLKFDGDAFDTDYIARRRTLGDILVTFRMEGGKWQSSLASRMPDRRDPEDAARDGAAEHLAVYFDRYYTAHGDFNDHYADLELTVRLRTEGDALFWTLRLRNLADRTLTIGDLGLPLPFNTGVRWDKTEMYTERLIPHPFVSLHGSFLFWMRPNGVGPYLVMTPLADCPAFESPAGFRPAKLEYQDERAVYIHAAAAGSEAIDQGGDWRIPLTDLALSPRSTPGSEAVYGFKFRWADGYAGVRNVLVEEGLCDVHAIPGMTVPEDLEARFSIRSLAPVESVVPEFPDDTVIEEDGVRAGGNRVYRARFSRLGENALTMTWGGGRTMRLEFFVTEPLETLIKKRAAHLAGRQQHRDPSLWYDGLFSDWDMRSGVLRSPDDTDGLKDFWVASDDPGLCKAPYIAQKNLHFPLAKEIEAVEYYIENFVWGKLQRTDRERWPYGIYGIPNWKAHRESGPEDRDAWIGHLWRLADYPHIIMLYANMARIAGLYPGLTRALSREEYLERAFGTALAYFTVPLETGGWSAVELCRMNELVIVPLIEDLDRAGRADQAGRLRALWEKKVEHYVNDRPNLLHAEYPGNPCAFESSQALARYAVEHAGRPGSTLRVAPADAQRFLEEQMTLNIALRGWLEPAYHLLGISRPGSGFYMSHMAGWSVNDYALYHAAEPERFMRLAYASYLGNWCLLNTGRPETDYGYWYPGAENDGAAGGNYVSQAFGEIQGKPTPRGAWFYGGEADMGFGAALRTAATVVVDDPVFGLFAYGGRLEKTADALEVEPRDGLRQRFHVLSGPGRLHLILDRDGFAAGRPVIVSDEGDEIRFTLESRFAGPHETTLRAAGLSPGTYEIEQDGRRLEPLRAAAGGESVIRLSGGPAESRVVIRKVRR